MPAVTVENPLVLPRIPRPRPATTVARPALRTVPAHHAIEGAGFEVWRPFPGGLSMHDTDPFLLLDQLGPVEYEPDGGEGCALAPAPRLRDGHLRPRRRDRPPRLERWRWRDRRGRHAVDDRGWRHPARRGADRARAARRRSVARRAAVGEPAVVAQVHAAALPGDHRRPPGAALVRRRRRARAAHRRRPRRPPRSGRHPHADHATRTRRSQPGAELTVPWNPAFSAMAYVLARPGLRGRGGPAGVGAPARRLRSGRHDLACGPPTTRRARPTRSRCSCSAGSRSASPSRTTARS